MSHWAIYGLGHFAGVGLAFRKDREIVRISNQGSFSFDHALRVIGYTNCRFHTVKRNIREQWRDYTSLRCSRFCCGETPFSIIPALSHTFN